MADPAATALTGAAMAARRDQRNEQDESARPACYSTSDECKREEEWVGAEARALCYCGGGGGAASCPSTVVDGINSDVPAATATAIGGRETRTRRSVLCRCVLGRPFAALSSSVWSIMEISQDANEAGRLFLSCHWLKTKSNLVKKN